jgi:hypothetical protein
MDAAELRDGVVAVLDEHAVVETLGSLHARGGQVAALIHVLGELVQEEPSQGLRGPRVAREERSLHDLRQVHEGEHRALEVREVARQDRALVLGEVLGGEPERHGVGDGDSVGDGDGVMPW